MYTDKFAVRNINPCVFQGMGKCFLTPAFKRNRKRPTTTNNSARLRLTQEPNLPVSEMTNSLLRNAYYLNSCFSSKLLVFILQEEMLWVKGDKTLQLINLLLKRGKKTRTLRTRKEEVTAQHIQVSYLPGFVVSSNLLAVLPPCICMQVKIRLEPEIQCQ